MKKRYVRFKGCAKHNIEIEPGQCCPVCGCGHMRRKGNYIWGARLQVFVECRRRWWNPSTWGGGAWVWENQVEEVAE